jgi:hypothetical protein
VIEDLGLLDFPEVKLHEPAPGAAYLPDIQRAREMMDQQSRIALMGMMADQFEGSHIGNYDIHRMFKFYLHRHGVEELRETEIEDGRISYEGRGFADKAVSVMSEREMGRFSDRVKEAYRYRKEEQPKLGE